jgi:hypothetical protein
LSLRPETTQKARRLCDTWPFEKPSVPGTTSCHWCGGSWDGAHPNGIVQHRSTQQSPAKLSRTRTIACPPEHLGRPTTPSGPAKVSIR